MPPKTRKVDFVPLTDSARLIYDNILSSHLKAREKKNATAADAAAQQHLFTSLRKAANHPLLLRTRFSDESEKQNLAQLLMNYGYFGNDASLTLTLVKEELENFSDYDIHCACEEMISENPARREFLGRYTLLEDDLFSSSKFVRLRELLPDLISKGHRILLFSQWTKVLDLMLNLMESLEMSCLRLDGSTQVSERQGLIDRFNSDQSIHVFLLSTRAGGMGLNLTAADVCILHDLDFNPFNDLQAEDRCHRIGQKKPVTIIKMVTQGTVDEDIYSIQERKARMNKAIMEESGKKDGKSKENEEKCAIARAAVENFLKSPKRSIDNKAEPIVIE
jgi:SWI/SNF-related matrix-associated actin-dependent regulator 1 of chromatin subfamily A